MDATATLMLTTKGEQEVQTRTFKLDIRKRSILLLLSRPRSLGELLERNVYPGEEVLGELGWLTQQGFVQLPEGQAAPALAAAAAVAGEVSALPALDPEIILAEARFALVDFCVDQFGTSAPALIAELEESRSVKAMQLLVNKIAQTLGPKQLDQLRVLIEQVNESA